MARRRGRWSAGLLAGLGLGALWAAMAAVAFAQGGSAERRPDGSLYPPQAARGLWDAILDPWPAVGASALRLPGSLDALQADPRVPRQDHARALGRILSEREHAEVWPEAATAAKRFVAPLLPPEAGEVLLATLRDGAAAPSSRQSAARALAALPPERVPAGGGEALLGILRDGAAPFDLRKIAARTLTELPPERVPAGAWEALLAVLRDVTLDIPSRALAEQPLGALPPQRVPAGAGEALLAVLRDVTLDTPSRALAALALAALPPERVPIDAGEALLATVRDGAVHPGLRDAAARAIAKLPPERVPAGAREAMLAIQRDGAVDPRLRDSMARAFAALPPERVPAGGEEALLATLQDRAASPSSREAAVQAIAKLPPDRVPAGAWEALLATLRDGAAGHSLRQSAARALAALPPERVPAGAGEALLPTLRDSRFDRFLWHLTAEVFAVLPPERIPAGAGEVLLANMRLGGDVIDPVLRRFAAQAFAKLPPERIPAGAWEPLFGILRDRTFPAFLRLFAAQAIGKLPLERTPADAWEAMLGILREGTTDAALRELAAESLASLQAAPWQLGTVKQIAELLDRQGVGQERPFAIRLLSGVSGPEPARVVLEVGTASHPKDRPLWRALGHLAGGGGPEARTLMAWLARPQGEGAPPGLAALRASPDKAAPVLEVLRRHWPEAGTRLRQEATDRVHQIVLATCGDRPAGQGTQETNLWHALLARLPIAAAATPCWTGEQRRLVAAVAELMDPGAARDAVVAHLEAGRVVPWAALAANGGAALGAMGALLWGGLLLRFPRSRRVQALFLFQPRARALLSAPAFFLPLLLWLLPGTRRWLLRPFRGRLLASAQLAQFREAEWFAETEAEDLRSKERRPLAAALPRLDRLVVLQGEPGLGKTTALRRLALRHPGPLAFLNARECEDGVLERIAAMIHDFEGADAADGRRDLRALKAMIWSGDLAIVVDGLNEVSAETRGRIVDAFRDMPDAAIAVGTQPLAWTPPDAATWLELKPLDRGRIEAFLRLRARARALPAGSARTGADFERAVEGWLARVLDEAPSGAERDLALHLLSNPFDLTFAADLLSRGEDPAPGDLVESAYDLAQAEYRRLHGREFPEARFAELAYARRLEARNDLLEGEMPAEVGPLGKHRLLRVWERKAAAGETVWTFRHDRVMDLFLYKAFEAKPGRLAEHEDDRRFRGVYLRLAQKAPEEVATALRDRLVLRAAQTQDHSLSDAYVKLHAARQRARRNLGRRATRGEAGETTSAGGSAPLQPAAAADGA